MSTESQDTDERVSSRMRTFFIVWFGQIISVVGSSLTGFGLAIWLFLDTGSVVVLAGVIYLFPTGTSP